MDFSLERKSKNCYRKTVEQETICEATGECVVPDTQEDIRQILCANFTVKLRSKDIENGEINVRAELSATVMYYSDNGIETLCLTLPANTRIPAQDADISSKIIASLRVSSWEARTINPRKLGLTAYVSFHTECYNSEELVWFLPPDGDYEKMYFRNSDESIICIGTVTEKEATVTDELDSAAGENGKLISAAVQYKTDGYETVGSRLIIRCFANIEAIFESNGKLIQENFSVPYSQLFDLDGECEKYCTATPLSTGEYFEHTDGKLIVELHTVLQLVCGAEEKLCFSDDAFSCNSVTKIDYETQKVCTQIDAIGAKENIQMNLDVHQSVSELILTRAAVTKTDVQGSNVRVAIVAEQVFKDTDGEIRCGRVRGSCEFDLENAEICRCFMAEIVSVKGTLIGDSVEISAEIRLNARREYYSEIKMISAVSSEGAIAADKASAYVVITDADIWDIAKKYKSAPDEIIEISDETDSHKKYFVPVIK